MSKHSQKAALVTGGSKRIGREIILFLAQNDYDIALHYNTSKKDAVVLQDEVNQMGRHCEIFKSDLNNLNESSQLMKKVKAKFKNLELLINNASVFEKTSFKDKGFAHLERDLNIHVNSPFILMRDFSTLYKKGIIINMLETHIVHQKSPYFTYLLAKKALASLTQMAALELGPNFRVNGIAPGIILPPKERTEKQIEAMAKKIPLQRRGFPSDIVRAVEFLINHEFITGQTIFCDGGEHLL